MMPMMVENHTFDNLFGNFLAATGSRRAMDYQPGRGYQMDSYTR
jgi:phospholipase C